MFDGNDWNTAFNYVTEDAQNAQTAHCSLQVLEFTEQSLKQIAAGTSL